MFTSARRMFAFVVAVTAAVGVTVAIAEQVTSVANQDSPGDLVLVAGATGRTGQFVVTELLAHGYRVRAFVRDVDEAREKLGQDIEYAEGDVRQRETIDAALDGVAAIICTIGAGRGDPSNSPEFVDYGGVKNLAEAAAAARLNQFVLISSGGVTHEDHVLNKMFNNVLMWKFKGEEAVRNSGVPYTIVRPGGLVDKESDVATMIFLQGDEAQGLIPRADVAKVLVEALEHSESLHKTFEVIGGGNDPALDWSSRFAALKAD